ncbi:MAG: right-handed parallel beta-helix repeat-containing protein [Akkermansiaceae bacterium]|nr:right-handed parallel beta-helix repeat-containing protein [Akkermansiaceae bacterium]
MSYPPTPRLPAIFAMVFALSATSLCGAATYYVHPVHGDDTNAGTSPKSAFRTLKRASDVRLQAGDRVLLASGQKFTGQLALEGLSGEANQPIVISTYPSVNGGDESRAGIDAKGQIAGVFLKNCANIVVENLIITAKAGGENPASQALKGMRCGVLVEADQPGDYAGFKVANLVVKDVFFEEPGFIRPPSEVKSANGTQNYGWGIRFISTSPKARMRDITITDCRISNVCHTGLKLTAPGKGLQNVDVRRLVVENTGGPGVQMSGVQGGHFSELNVNGSGSTKDSRNWGRGSGLWTWGSDNVLIEKSQFRNANGPGDSAGVHIDYNCRDVIVQYNLSSNNAGGFCEILGNNFNCAYRYNVSINDGHRVKGVNGAFQEGKIFWLSGYTGHKSPLKGPYHSYFYNNTIFVSDENVARISVAPSARGVLVANNIFYFRGGSKTVTGDQGKRDIMRGAAPGNVVFSNNLFLDGHSWPADAPIKDQSPIVGNPDFKQGGGGDIKDYLPRNAGLVRDKGLRILKLPGDDAGLLGGLDLKTDICGSRILGLPDIGALELPPQ